MIKIILGTVVIYQGLLLSFHDTDSKLKPFTDYQYRIRAFNNVSDTNSPWSGVKTHQGFPEQVPSPTVKVIQIEGLE